MATLIGFKSDQVDTALTNGKTFALGDRAETYDGRQFVYVKASGAISQYDVVTFDSATYNTTVASVTTANALRGSLLGVAPVAIASGSYGWLQIYGPCSVNVKTLCAANTQINTTATGGALDDDATASAYVADRVLTTTTNSTSATAAMPAVINYPAVGAKL
jgi:hypothetical protein